MNGQPMQIRLDCQCLHRGHLGSLEKQFQFPQDWLQDWQMLSEGLMKNMQMFLDMLIQRVRRTIIQDEATEIVIKLLAFEHANKTCQLKGQGLLVIL